MTTPSSLIHSAVRYFWGPPNTCEMCGTLRGRRYEWSNKNHLYRPIRDEWWMLCSKCHAEFDRSYLGKPDPWNKGFKKFRPTKTCACGRSFQQNRVAQTYCASYCASRFNGRAPKRRYLLENNLLTPKGEPSKEH